MQLLILSLLAVLATSAQGHMMMSIPAPRQWKTNPGANGEIDYSYTAPLGTFPCKGYSAQAPILTVAAGSSIATTISGGAPHGGGHCQFALSYDGDKTWVVVDTIIRSCAQFSNPYLVNVKIPATAPSGKATFAWTWINAIGNREYYMSCTDIVITGGSGPEGTLSGPQLLVGNLPGSKYQFPEFPGTLPDNRAFFDERPTITVRGSRVAYNGAAPAKQATPAKQAPAGQVTASTPSVPASSSPSAKKKSAPAAFSASYCAAGQYSCSADKTAILQCNFGAWASHPVPAGTVCVTNGPGSAYIGRA